MTRLTVTRAADLQAGDRIVSVGPTITYAFMQASGMVNDRARSRPPSPRSRPARPCSACAW